ncbi:4-alpha-L-fucosyltransferase [Linnemannia gamsii]|uniref:Fucosyltransferase n=1 Tax=Linnemannia gamsii TaxID=64522 RepID=A0ABQ7K7G1_9FUNG|nr:4-alpha-L-fucosyltransferase [Linnemannia gamsii]
MSKVQETRGNVGIKADDPAAATVTVMGLTISRNRIPRGFIIRSISLIIIILVIFQTYVSHIQTQSPLKQGLLWATSNPKAKYNATNNDELTIHPPTYNLEKFCSSYPTRPTKKHHILIPNKAKEDGPLKIFYWKQLALEQKLDWHKESETMCPIEDRPGSCTSREYGRLDYIFSTNYTDFVNADIIYMDYAFTMGIDKAPYFDQMLLPPRLAHQSWALLFFDESVGYYPHVAMPAFLNQFDLTMGSPPQLMDIPNPTYPITKEKALELASIEPTHPFDKTPEHFIAFMISNCAAKNDRMGLIDKLVETAGAHSYGHCGHNKEMPEELKGREVGSWQYKKQKTLASYPFGLAAENSNCLGYITEKIYDVYASGSIPIYMGAPDIADFVPEGSYIDVRNFKTYDDLIQYMKTVDREPFYRWKDIVKKDPTKFCKKCLYTGPPAWCTIMDNVHFV